MRCYIRRASPARYSIFAVDAVVALFFLSAGVLPSQAQSRSPAQSRREGQAPPGRRDMRMNKSIQERQRDLLSLEKKKELPSREREERLSYQQLKLDFEQLQVINNNLSTVVDSRAALDYEQIRKDAAEINKRATRLRANFALPELEKDEKPKKESGEFTPEGLKWALKVLDTLVQSFVYNPIFQQLKVIDVEASRRASRDLEAIISLSERIHKRAEVLNKAARKSL
ncbi:MAG TPA: hypothetical protein VF766_07095 [Pyrinomonadaceae bacterium]